MWQSKKFLDECGKSFGGDYQRATESLRENNIFREVILACALTPSDSSGVFKPSEVNKAINLIYPGNSHHQTRVRQYLVQFISERRGKILIRSGTKADYRYRFADPLMQPFIVMRAIKDTMIDQSLRHLLLHSGREGFRGAQSSLEVAEP
jgi:hypothetical protein